MKWHRNSRTLGIMCWCIVQKLIWTHVHCLCQVNVFILKRLQAYARNPTEQTRLSILTSMENNPERCRQAVWQKILTGIFLSSDDVIITPAWLQTSSERCSFYTIISMTQTEFVLFANVLELACKNMTFPFRWFGVHELAVKCFSFISYFSIRPIVGTHCLQLTVDIPRDCYFNNLVLILITLARLYLVSGWKLEKKQKNDQLN